MRKIRDWMRDPKQHKNASMFAFNMIAHGTQDGWLKSAEEDGGGLHINDILGSLKDVKTLQGKPKVLFIDACRGSKYSADAKMMCYTKIRIWC